MYSHGWISDFSKCLFLCIILFTGIDAFGSFARRGSFSPFPRGRRWQRESERSSWRPPARVAAHSGGSQLWRGCCAESDRRQRILLCSFSGMYLLEQRGKVVRGPWWRIDRSSSRGVTHWWSRRCRTAGDTAHSSCKDRHRVSIIKNKSITDKYWEIFYQKEGIKRWLTALTIPRARWFSTSLKNLSSSLVPARAETSILLSAKNCLN